VLGSKSAARSSRDVRRNKMAKKAKKTAKLHKGKKLEAQKPLTHSEFTVPKYVDIATPK
jgi:hypothetical protein